MNKTAIILLGLVLALGAFYLTAHFVGSSREAPADTPAFTVSGTPGAVYDAILPEVRDRIARDTKIVRIDDASGSTLRFSAYLEDHSVRLVEVRLTTAGPNATQVAVNSRQFSFMPGRSRDAQDAVLESSIAALIQKRASAIAP